MPPAGQGPMSLIPSGLKEGDLVLVNGHCFMGLHDLKCQVIQIFPNGEVSVHYPGHSNPADAMSFTVRGDRLTIIEPPQEPDTGSGRPRRTQRVPNHLRDYACGEYKKCWFPKQ